MIFKVVSPKDKYKDDSIYEDIEEYCMDRRKTPNGYIVGFNLDLDSAGIDMYMLANRFEKLKGTRIRHMILSFDPERESEISHLDAFYIARDVCRYYAEDYQIFAAVHEDTNAVHIHIVMNTVHIRNGEKYKGRKKDYYDFQQHLRSIVRSWGLKLEVSGVG